MKSTDPTKFDVESALLGEAWLAFTELLDAAEARRPPVDGGKIAEELTSHCRERRFHAPVKTEAGQPLVSLLSVAATLLLTCNLVFPSMRTARPKETPRPTEAAVGATWDDGLDETVAAIAARFARLQQEEPASDSFHADSIRERIQALQSELLDETL